jgi:hypothetical protein
MRMRRSRSHYEPTLVYLLAERARADGVDLDRATGPWRAAQRRRNHEDVPIVTNGRTGVMVDTMGHAADVAGLLNWCGVLDLNPVPELVPSPDSFGFGDEPAEPVALAG